MTPRRRVRALSVRLTLTKRLALLAARDGWVALDPELSLLGHRQRFTNITIRVMYARVDDRQDAFVLTPVFALRAAGPGGPD